MNQKTRQPCDHEFEVIATGYSYDHDSGKVYKFFKKKCKKCKKIKIFKLYDLNRLGDYGA
jgi:hypothetical protein